jgi:Tol biopolymer transport system component
METVAEADSYYSHDLSPDNRHVVWELLTEANGFGDIWVYDLERGTHIRLAGDAGWKFTPHFWPDGSKIAYIWYRPQPNRWHFAIKPANGSGSEELAMETHTIPFLDDVSTDGAFLLYTQTGPPYTLWVLPLAGDRRPILIRSSKGDNAHGQFSGDGRWIAYMSADSGRREIHVQDFQPSASGPKTHGELTVVSTGGGSSPRWSADGKELFYLAPDNSLMAVPVKTGTQFSAGRPEKLFQLPIAPGSPYRRPYVPSADGRRFLIAVPESGGAQSPVAVVVTNWMETLVK